LASDLDSLLHAIAALAEDGVTAPGDPAAPNLDGAALAADGLRERAAAEHPAWWDAARGGVKLAGLDLRGASLRSADLSGANLGGSDLSGAKGPALCLRGAHLEQARFDGADLAGADLGGAKAGEASFDGAMLEDASLIDAGLRYASLREAILDGATLDGADLWGARLDAAEAQNASLRGARLDEANLSGADLSGADLEDATLKRADLRGATLRGANLRGASLDGAQLDGADLSGARLPLVALTGCGLRHVRLAGAWLERTQMQAGQLGGAIGEELAGEFDAARDGYTVLEQNFNSLGDSDAASWAFRQRRRMGKREALLQARACWRERRWRPALGSTAAWLSDAFAEWLCDYGESLPRVARALTVVLLAFAVLYGATGSLVPKDGTAPAASAHGVVRQVAELLLYSLVSMTTVGTGDLGLRPSGDLVYLAASVQSIVGTVLLGLFGFVLGNRLRR
jgi:uncharacterized protein YjbI with pentapeptide repeats